MDYFLSEFLATLTLILLGDGVVANVTLNKSGMKGGGSVQITIAWGLAVAISAFMYGGSKGGATMNPACVVGNMILRNVTISNGLIMIVAEVLGAFVGAFTVHMFFKQQFNATEDAGTKLGVFSTGPSVRHNLNNFFCEFVGTAVLFFYGNAAGLWGPDASSLAALPVLCIIIAIGMSLGGTTGYAINPARDAGPRLYHTVAFRNDNHNWNYGWIPIIAPTCGVVFAALLTIVLRSVPM